MRRGGLCLVVAILLLALACGLSPAGSETANTGKPVDTATSPLLAFWQARYPGLEWLKLSLWDLNGDGRDDLVVIYQAAPDACDMVVVLDFEGGYQLTESTPAPLESQHIEILDFDDKQPYEIYVSGRNGIYVGSAIFRVVDDSRLDTMFSDGYGDC